MTEMPTPPSVWVYKICSRLAWEKARAEGYLEPSAADCRDGFVHLSARHQVAETLRKHFSTESDLVLLTVDTRRVPPGSLRWEISRGGDSFPHLYAKLAAEYVVESRALTIDSTGRHELPASMES
jgi:uncharacterized protein (DUF952 family)